MAIDIRRVTRLAIGINTENGVEEYRFDIWPWREEHPQLNEFQINVTPPGGMPYKAQTHMDGFYLVWPITDRDTALPGDNGWYEIEAFGEGGLHKLSPKKPLVVYERMTGDLGEAPSSIQSWVEEANAVLDDNRKAVNEAQQAVNEAQQAAASANNAAEQANSAAEKIKTATNTSLGVVKGGRGILVKEDGSLFNANVVNLLDNSDFRNPVNQRGRAGSDLTSGYMLDRWRTWTDGADLYFNAGLYMSLEYVTLYQYIPAPYNRGVVTAAVKVYGVETPYVCTLDTSAVGSAFSGVAWLTREANALSIGLANGYSYEWAALYEGEYTAETLPPYVPKGYAAELAECQRYFQRLFIGNGFVSALAFSNTSARTVFFIPGMRTIPTVSSDIPLRFYVSGSYKSVSSVTVSDMTESAMTIYFTSEGLVTGDVYGIHPNGGTATITLSADL